jgi:SCY1-like protein 2
MFSNALKSFTSNINSNYTLSSQPTSFSGPWKIYDAKKKSTGKAASVFVFEKKSLEPPGGGSLGGRSSASQLKRAQEEVVERLKKEASSLARLRHPSILEIAEPVEETRGGGLMFATEPVTASLAGLLQEKDDQEKAGGVGGRRSRYVIEEADGQKRRRELEIDELEIQKGLLQIAKGLEFLHESAGLVHANLTPEAIFVNAKVGNIKSSPRSTILIYVTVRLENIWAWLLQPARKLIKANLSRSHIPFRGPEL